MTSTANSDIANNFKQERGLPLQQPPIGESNDEVVA